MSETGGAGRLAPARAAGVSPITFRKLGGSANDASTAATRRGQKLAPAHLDRHILDRDDAAVAFAQVTDFDVAIVAAGGRRAGYFQHVAG